MHSKSCTTSLRLASPRPSPTSSATVAGWNPLRPAPSPSLLLQRSSRGGRRGVLPAARGGVEGKAQWQVHGVGTPPHDTGPHTTRGACVVCFGMTLELVRHMSRHRVMAVWSLAPGVIRQQAPKHQKSRSTQLAYGPGYIMNKAESR